MSRIHLRAAAALAALLSLPALASAQHKHTDKTPMKNIVQVAIDAGNFKTLATALQAAGLVDAIQGPGPFTVFAPTDAAFAKLPAGTLDQLLADKEKLTSILTYHVVSGRVMAADVLNAKGAKPATLNGQTLDITVRGDKVYVNGAQVITADLIASNGVIHVIDRVLIPTPAPAAAAR